MDRDTSDTPDNYAKTLRSLRTEPGADSIDNVGAFLDVALPWLVSAEHAAVPLPGSGKTLLRWQILAAVAGVDLSLVKLFEAHTDAISILHELAKNSDVPRPRSGELWAVWCAEPPGARLRIDTETAATHGRVTLNGVKAWCSGAHRVSHALVSGWNASGQPCLAAVALDQPHVRIVRRGWHAVGMAATDSVEIEFDGAAARIVGAPGAYTARAGFWQGGMGVAACWYGAMQSIAGHLYRHAARTSDHNKTPCNPHVAAHVGAIAVQIEAAASVLQAAAGEIDRRPAADCRQLALRVRLTVEAACTDVMQHVGRALGAGPLCKEPELSRLMADLPVFLRQSHAERDLAALGELVCKEGASWQL